MMLHIRKSSPDDLLFLEKLEKNSFPGFQQNNRRSLALSLTSPFQEVWIAEKGTSVRQPVGAMVLYLYKKSLRIYSLATLPGFQNSGVGSFLLNHALNLATSRKQEKLILEADATNERLLEWYQQRGFKPVKTVKDYYAEGFDCVKLEYPMPALLYQNRMKNIIVVNQPRTWQFTDVNAKIISVKEYISNTEYHTDNSLRVFNLCSSYQYQSYGYYVSLLASARGQRVIPNVTTIRDFSSTGVIRSITTEINELLQTALRNVKGKEFSMNVYFGHTNVRGMKRLALKFYQLFETPLFKVHFIRNGEWMIKKIQPLNLNKVTNDELIKVNEFAREYFDKKRFNKSRLTAYKYDLAILVNPQEATPPSCNTALKLFKQAANRKGIYTEFITKNDFDKINEFDALFIRETTSVNNHTYELSRLAYAEGLVVIDDPWSILRCSNKIYQNELFRNNKILTPKTITYTKNLFQPKDLDEVSFPMVIKQPDSAFSLGITKANNKEEALEVLNNLFKKSDMVIGQEFMYSEFDWRVGIIDNTPLFACKYYMTKDHWQIYNWQGEAEEQSGGYETLPISAVPRHVLDTALKAAALIGDGLYGVDLKEIDGKVYVMEVNDNPNIDFEVEDAILGEKLYDMVIDSFLNRIEIAKNLKRYVSSK